MFLDDTRSFEWDPQLETGYGRIDNQHQQLFSAVKKLMEASVGGKGPKAVLDTLEFLTSYAVKHFDDEEQLQRNYDYPDYLTHKKIHNDFKDTVSELIQKVNQEGPSEVLIEEVCGIVRAWLLNHIKGDDFRMAVFIKTADSNSMGEE